VGTLPQSDRRPVQFGVFQLSPSTGELRKHGIRIRLQEQPLKLLLSLLETPGDIRTREELIRTIWADGTFVDYERGLNVGMTRLRQALGDSADAPRYIETVGRKGYRFIAPVERLPSAEMSHPAPESVTATVPEEPLAIPPPEPAVARRGMRPWQVLAVVGAALVASVALLPGARWRSPEAVSQRLVRLSFDLGPDMAGAGLGTGSLLALSRDGSRVAVSVTGPDGQIRMATRRFDQSQLTILTGTEQAASPFFSPDGQWIAFFADGKLKKIPTEGGAPVNLCDADTHAAGRASMYYPSGAWADDGNIIAALNVADGLSRIPAGGGQPELLGMKGEAEEVFRWPQILPGGEAVLFSSARGDYENGNIDVFSLKTGERKTVARGGILGKYVAAGYLVYLHQNELLATPFDLKTLKVSGSPHAVLEDMGGRLAGWNYDVSDNGTFVYESALHDPRDSIFWLDRAGKLSPLQTVPGFYSSPAFSPDGKRLAFSMSGRSSQGIWVQNIWVQDLNLGTASPLTSLSAVNDSPIWTADGRDLVFRSVNQPDPGIYTIPADGGGAARRLADLTTGVFPGSITPDGKWLATWAFAAAGAVWIAPLQPGTGGPRLGKPEQLFQTMKISRTSPAFSPDGRWLAYCSLESGLIEVYVRPFPGPGGKVRISTTGGTHPVWSRNGRELFYMTRPGRKLMVTRYKVANQTFIPGEPEVWSDKQLLDLGELNTYDAAPDGNRLAVVLYADGTADQKPASSLTVLLNFFDELRRRAPRR
jgi:Tol biopolymer transport system component/DNA-binding winged helix-turn-helix (wHTH) protein